MELNWVEVDRFFHYVRPYRCLATIFSSDGNVWYWEVIGIRSHCSGNSLSLKEAKSELEKLKDQYFE